MVMSLQSDHLTRRLLMETLKPHPCASLVRPWATAPLCLLGAGESWAQTKNPALGLPTPSTKCFPCQGPSWILSIVSLQVLLMSELSRLQDTWSKQRMESKDGVYSPQRKCIFLININGYRKKSWSFFISFQNEQVLDQIKLVQEASLSYMSPKLTWKPGSPGPDKLTYFSSTLYWRS